MTREYNY